MSIERYEYIYEGIFTVDRAEAVKKAAKEFGYYFEIRAREGGESSLCGEVPEGKVSGCLPIEVVNDEKFWARARRLQEIQEKSQNCDRLK